MAAIAAMAAADQAFAAGTLIPTKANASVIAGADQAFVGPQLTDTGAAWIVAPRRGQSSLQLWRGSGPAAQLSAVGSSSFVALAASGSRVAYQRVWAGCARPGCSRPGLLADEVQLGSTTEPPTRFSGCDTAAGVRCDPGAPGFQPRIALTPDALVVTKVLPTVTHTLVTNFDAGLMPTTVELPTGPYFAAAGRYVAAAPGLGPITVFDRLTGAALYQVAGEPSLMDVQADGTIAFADGAGRVAWASIAAPTPHLLTTLPQPQSRADGTLSLHIADDKVLIIGARSGTVTANLQPLNGPARVLPSLIGALSYTDVDFDGTRMTWATQPCSVISVAVWDVDDAAAFPTPPRRCFAPPVLSVGRVRADGRLVVQLTCPSGPRMGCEGTVRGTFGGGLAWAPVAYKVPPFTIRGVTVQLTRAARAELHRTRVLHAVGRVDASSPAGLPTVNAARQVAVRPAR